MSENPASPAPHRLRQTRTARMARARLARHLQGFGSDRDLWWRVQDLVPEAWATVEGIEFRSATVRAYKGKEGPCLDQKQAVIYNGPWKQVVDDDGHLLRRGVRTAVCGKTYEIYTRAPYAGQITPVPAAQAVPAEQAAEFDCRLNKIRDPRETKGPHYHATQLPGGDCCGTNGCC